jgi:hypothetical protein
VDPAMTAQLEAESYHFVSHLHGIGPRPLGEFLRELGAQRLIFTESEMLLRRYRRLDPEAVVALGGRRWK